MDQIRNHGAENEGNERTTGRLTLPLHSVTKYIHSAGFILNDFMVKLIQTQNNNEAVATMLLTFDEAREYLDGIADGIPAEIYEKLNGGVILSPDEKLHPESKPGGVLYVMGEYVYQSHGLGRYIVIYYGSFCKTQSGRSAESQRRKLREVLYHELTHHLENLAGDESLEQKDRVFIEKYKQSHGDG